MAGYGNAHMRQGPMLLTVDNIEAGYATGRGKVARILEGLSLDLKAGEVLGVVGESGCGKSTMARAIMQVPSPLSGEVVFAGENLVGLPPGRVRQARRRMQLIMQDPVGAMNPGRRVKDIVGEGLAVWPTEGDRRSIVSDALNLVGLDPAQVGNAYPRELSGGQAQRVCIARALVLTPSVLICDEVVASLDVSVQAQVLNVLQGLQRDHSLSLIFISHDLDVVGHISDRILVMYRGRICELLPASASLSAARHPYTKLLHSSAPGALVEQAPMSGFDIGEVSASAEPGCKFRARCPAATAACGIEPVVRQVGDDHFVACHNV